MDLLASLKPIMAVSKIVGAAPYGVTGGGDIKIVTGYPWVIFGAAVATRLYVWFRYGHLHFNENAAVTTASVLDAVAFDVMNAAATVIFLLASVRQVRDILLILRCVPNWGLRVGWTDLELIRVRSRYLLAAYHSLAVAFLIALFIEDPFDKGDFAYRAVEAVNQYLYSIIPSHLQLQFVVMVLILNLLFAKMTDLTQEKLASVRRVRVHAREGMAPEMKDRRRLTEHKLATIKRLRGLYDWLEDLTEDIIDAFAVVNFLSISFCFVDILYSTNYFIIEKAYKYNTLYVLWITFLLLKLFAAVTACTMTSNKADQTAQYLHEVLVENDDPEIREELEIFSLQLLHRKVDFNACGFFKLDFTLIYSMVGAVTTYIVILMQFQTPPDSDILKKCGCVQ